MHLLRLRHGSPFYCTYGYQRLHERIYLRQWAGHQYGNIAARDVDVCARWDHVCIDASGRNTNVNNDPSRTDHPFVTLDRVRDVHQYLYHLDLGRIDDHKYDLHGVATYNHDRTDYRAHNGDRVYNGFGNAHQLHHDPCQRGADHDHLIFHNPYSHN